MGSAVFAAESTASTADLEKRVLELEQKQKAYDQWYTDFYVNAQNRVAPYLGEKISLGGFFETSLSRLEGPGMQTQTSANGQVLGINLAADFDESNKFVTQILTALGYPLLNPNNNPAVTPAQRAYGPAFYVTLVAQAYYEYTESEHLQIQLGEGYTPFGYAFQQREPVLFLRRGGPQLTTGSDSNTVGLAFPLWMGAHVHGVFFAESGRCGYNLYTFSPTTNSKSLGEGARLWKDFSENLTVGVSAQQGQLATQMFHAYAADIHYHYKNSGVTIEFARNEAADASASPKSYYIEPYMNFHEGQLVVYVAADYLDHPSHINIATPDPFERWQYAAGVNWLPLPNARLRLGYAVNDYIGTSAVLSGQDRDYSVVDFSAGIAF